MIWKRGVYVGLIEQHHIFAAQSRMCHSGNPGHRKHKYLIRNSPTSQKKQVAGMICYSLSDSVWDLYLEETYLCGVRLFDTW
jgi:hypothetical protein